MTIEELPFTVAPVTGADQWAAVVALRVDRYGDKIAELRRVLSVTEPEDRLDDVLVLGAWADGMLLGTIRCHDNAHRPLPLEASVDLPDDLRGRRLAEACRLVVVRGEALVKLALFKAFYLWAVDRGAEALVVAARDGVWQQYEWLLFADAVPGLGAVPLHHAADVPHRIMALPLAQAYERWSEAAHPLLDFFGHTVHPALEVAAVRSAAGTASR